MRGYWARNTLLPKQYPIIGMVHLFTLMLLRSMSMRVIDGMPERPRSWRWRSRLHNTYLRGKRAHVFALGKCMHFIQAVLLWEGGCDYRYSLMGPQRGHFQSSIPLNLSSFSLTSFIEVEFALAPPSKYLIGLQPVFTCHNCSWSKFWDLYSYLTCAKGLPCRSQFPFDEEGRVSFYVTLSLSSPTNNIYLLSSLS